VVVQRISPSGGGREPRFAAVVLAAGLVVPAVRAPAEEAVVGIAVGVVGTRLTVGTVDCP
jgi:hypothetical protein